tara:strand:+ start:210 stop:440 length:231 start_codon:yes stop_codon:yes gene_type:complete
MIDYKVGQLLYTKKEIGDQLILPLWSSVVGLIIDIDELPATEINTCEKRYIVWDTENILCMTHQLLEMFYEYRRSD